MAFDENTTNAVYKDWQMIKCPKFLAALDFLRSPCAWPLAGQFALPRPVSEAGLRTDDVELGVFCFERRPLNGPVCYVPKRGMTLGYGEDPIILRLHGLGLCVDELAKC